MTLNTESNMSQPDNFYQMLMDAHRGLSDEQSVKLNAKLVLLLANHIGDMSALLAALKLARQQSAD